GTMGALYWQLNDIWPAPTWASIEFGGKWKILHSFARHFYDNLLVSPYLDNNNIKVSLVRDDYYGKLDFDLSVKVYDWSQNRPIYEHKSRHSSDSFSAQVIYDISLLELHRVAKCSHIDCHWYWVLSVEVTN
ncbi:unnamed protein product, partial [Medioppia subpectinata]